MNDSAELAGKISDAIAQLVEQDGENTELERYLAREAEVRDLGQTKIEGKISGHRDWNGACIGSVEFYTNGPQGGDAGHGGFIRVTFRNAGSTCIEVALDDRTAEPADAVAITFRGDAEIQAFIDSIKFLAFKLRDVETAWRLLQPYSCS